MRYQLLTPWPVGQFCVEAGTVIDLNKPEVEYTQPEKLVEGHTPPLFSTLALDWDCAETMWRNYPEFRHKLRRALGPFHEEMFERLVRGELQVLSREQVSLAQSDYPERLKKDRAEQAKRKQQTADFKRELQEKINDKAKEKLNG